MFVLWYHARICVFISSCVSHLHVFTLHVCMYPYFRVCMYVFTFLRLDIILAAFLTASSRTLPVWSIHAFVNVYFGMRGWICIHIIIVSLYCSHLFSGTQARNHLGWFLEYWLVHTLLFCSILVLRFPWVDTCFCMWAKHLHAPKPCTWFNKTWGAHWRIHLRHYKSRFQTFLRFHMSVCNLLIGVCMCTLVCVYIYIYIYIFVCMYVYINMYVCAYVSIYRRHTIAPLGKISQTILNMHACAYTDLQVWCQLVENRSNLKNCTHAYSGSDTCWQHI